MNKVFKLMRMMWLKKIEKDFIKKHEDFKMSQFNHKEERDYLNYIHEHKNNVKQVWEDFLNNPSIANGNVQLDCCDTYMLDVLIFNHDDSKLTSNEFNSYRSKFFPIEGESKYLITFKEAWNHHQKSNAHHWQYWIMWKDGESKAIPMNFYNAIEMIIDWTAMAYKFGDTPKEFYDKNKSTMLLHETTIEYIERFLPTFNALAIKHNN